MRETPTWRIPIGVLGICAGLAIYGLIVAWLVAPAISGWHTLAQLPVYIVLGVVWLLPLRRYLIWMETGRWRAPEDTGD